MNYRHTLYHEDIIFSPTFSVQDCALIKNEGDKWGLRWSSFGSDTEPEQFIVLSWYRTPLELVDFIRANGGETIRYQLAEATDPPKGLLIYLRLSNILMQIKLLAALLTAFYYIILR